MSIHLLHHGRSAAARTAGGALAAAALLALAACGAAPAQTGAAAETAPDAQTTSAVHAMPTPLPGWALELTIPLEDLAPCGSPDGTQAPGGGEAAGQAVSLDMDGDGADELVTGDQIRFQRDGQTYLADLPALLAEHWPNFVFWNYGCVDADQRLIRADGLMTVEGWGEQTASFVRLIRFDGDRLLVYRDKRMSVDHVLEGVTAPEEVLEAAKARAEAQYDSMRSRPAMEEMPGSWEFDDWRIIDLWEIPLADFGWQWEGPEVLVYGVRVQLHTPSPETLILAGGSLLDEEGWYTSGYISDWSPYLVYIRQEDGSLRQLDDSALRNTGEGSPRFLEALAQILAQSGYGAGE